MSILYLIVLGATGWLLSLDTARTKRDRVNPLSIPEVSARGNDLVPAGAIFRRVGVDETSSLGMNGHSESVREAIARAEIVGIMIKGLDHFMVSDHDLVFRSSRSGRNGCVRSGNGRSGSGRNGSGKSDSCKSDSGQQSKDGLHFLEVVGGLIALRSVGQKLVFLIRMKVVRAICYLIGGLRRSGRVLTGKREGWLGEGYLLVRHGDIYTFTRELKTGEKTHLHL